MSCGAELWPFNLRKHAPPLTRRLHALGTGLGRALLLGAVVVGPWWYLLSDVRMAWCMVTGTLDAELEKAGVTPGR